MKKQMQFILENTAAGKIDKSVAAVLLADLKNHKSTGKMDIAVIGMSATMPQSSDIHEFWNMIADKRDCVTDYPADRRRDTEEYIRYMGRGQNLRYAKAGYLDEIDKFDYSFFGMSPKEAELMDPNQRLFLQAAWSAIEDAGYGGSQLLGKRTGVYVGYDNSTVNAYRQLIADTRPELLSLATTGNILPLIASRISHLLDFRGPSMLIDTTCSSSLLAIHVASRALQNKECETAIAGSVKITIFPVLPEDKLGVEAGDGRTKTFDDRSDGTGIGEGVGAVLLKPLDKALRDGDSIYAVIKGSAANHDGTSVGLTAPNVLAQEDVITRALKDANVPADSIGYIEAHGTGTRLGDPIEIDGITRAFKKETARKQFCAISSLKSNIGHLDHGSGIASFIKAVLALKYKQLPPTVHFERPNRSINFIDSPVYVNDRLKAWQEGGTPRRCGVSSFGLSGTNCHMILEEAPPKGASPSLQEGAGILGPYIMIMSAKSETALQGIVRSMSRYLQGKPAALLKDICYTLATGRGHYGYRLSLIVRDMEDAAAKLAELAENGLSHAEHKGIYYRRPLDRYTERPAIQGHMAQLSDGRELAELIGGLQTGPSYREKEGLLQGICESYTAGADVDWSGIYDKQFHRRVNLPAYAFDRIRCWITVPSDVTLQNQPSGQRTDRSIPSVHVEIAGVGELSGEFTETDGEVLQKVADAWGEVLGMNKLHAADHLFELGGDSIFAAKIISLLNNKLDLQLEIVDLMRYPVLGEFAAHIRTLTAERPKPSAASGLHGEITPSDQADYYPLTSPQRRLYVLDKLEEQSIAYNMPSAFLIEGSLDPVRLEQAFRRLIERHEILRTGFEMLDGEPVQRVYDLVPFELEPLECSEEGISRVMQSFIRPFRLASAPLLRAAVCCLSGERHALLFDIHHIVCDGASTEILTRELLLAYHNQDGVPMPIQFKDYIAWNRRLKQSGVYEQQASFWENELSGELPVIQLPLDYKRPSVQQFQGDKVSFHIDGELLRQLKQLAKKNDSTLYMVLLALLNVFLSKYSGQQDIIVGSPISGRRRPELEQMIGMFVNTLPMRNYPEPQLSFEDFLREVRNRALQAYNHQDFPFEDMVDLVKSSRDLSRNPIFDVMFMMQNVGLKEVRMEGLTFTPVHFDSTVSKVDLTMNVMERDESLSIDFEYATALFRRETAERMAVFFVSMAEEIVKDPARLLKDIHNVSPEEGALLNSFHGTELLYPRELGIHQLFERQAALTPEGTALVCGDKSLTYRELNERADRLAAALLRRGTWANKLIALLVPRSLEMVVGMLGILKAGAAYVPIDPDYPQERIRYMLEDSCSQMVLHTGNLDASLLPAEAGAIDLAAPAVQAEVQGYGDNPFDAQQLAYVIYTSGSTGQPKGVMVEHRQVHNFISGITGLLEFNPGKTLLSVTTISFDIFVLESLLALSQGTKVIIASNEEQNHPRLLGECLLKHKADMLQITPSRLQLLLESREGAAGVRALKEIMIGGEALPEALVRRIRGLGKVRIFNMYGPTETTVWSTVKELAADEDGLDITIGRPIANTQIYIVDEHMQAQPIGVPGELLIGGEGVVRGYMNRPELTEEKFILSPSLGAGRIYRTGDRAKWLANGEIQFLGRNDRLIKLRGYRVELGEIENALQLHPAVKEGAVIVREDRGGSQELYAYYALNNEVTAKSLRDHLENILPVYMVPGRFIRLDELPQTPNGKTDRKALQNMDDVPGYGEASAPADGPENELQQKLAEIWKNTLGMTHVGIHDNFFLMGGNSMKAIQMIAQAEEYSIPLLINDIFKHQTIAELEQYVRLSGKADHYLINPAEAEEWLSDQLGQKVRIIRLTVEDRSYCLYSLSNYNEEAVQRALMHAKQSVSGKIYPHYVVPAGALEEMLSSKGGETASEPSLGELETLLGLQPMSAEERMAAVGQICEDHLRYEKSILGSGIAKEYRLAPIEHFFLGKDRFSGTLLRFDNIMDTGIFNQAVVMLLKQQGVFRNTLIRKEGGLFWREFDYPDQVEIPYADISGYDAASRIAVMENIVSGYFFKEYEEWDSLYYRMVLVRENLRDYYLFLPVNHSIFDAMSGEIVKRSLMEFYEALESGRECAQEEDKTYLDYVEQVRRGPVQISDSEIVEAFKLDQYESVTNELNTSLQSYAREKSTYLKFEIRTRGSERVFDSDNSWQIAFDLLTKFVHKYLNHDILPVSVFYYGRNYQNKKFFNTVGEFIDLIPMVVNTKGRSAEQMADFIQTRINLAEQHNINFSNFAVDERARKRYPEVCRFIQGMQEQGSIIFNFQGKLEDQEMDAFEKLLYKRLMHELNLEEAVNIYFATRYSGDVIQIDISLPFDEDAARLLEFFKDECSIMSDIEVEKYE
jgi:amino acid adenylation domain-containing protein